MKMTIGMKIELGFAIACAIILLFGLMSYSANNTLIDALEQETESYKLTNHLDELLVDLFDANNITRGFHITGQEKYLETLNNLDEQVELHLQSYKKAVSEKKINLPELSGLEASIKALKEHRQELTDMRREKGLEAVQKAMISSSKDRTYLESIKREIDNVIKEGDRQSNDLEKRAHDLVTKQKFLIFFGIIVSVIILALVGVLITSNIAAPLRRITVVAEKISGGDLSGEISATSRTDEVGALQQAFSRLVEYISSMAGHARQIAGGDLTVKIEPISDKDVLGGSFSKMASNLRRQTLDLKDGIQVIASSSTEISSSTSEVSAGATETAAAVTETASTMEELKQSSMITTEKTKIVSETAQRAVNIAQSGEHSVNETIEKMNKIREQMASLAQSTIKLSEQSQAIGEIIASVEDIAEQSNLLAVNASIEAAKAGEQGKGFSVVAQEIRNLARQSKQATGQIRGILNDIQKAISAAVMDTEKGSKAVDAGVEQSVSAGKSIRDLVEGIEHAAIAASQITSSVAQQMAGIDQVATAVENIKLASNQNVESMGQIKIAAKNIQKLGEGLRELVEKYRL